MLPPNSSHRSIASVAQPSANTGVFIASKPRQAMVAKLSTSLLLLLVLLLGSHKAMGQTPQPANCNVCFCTQDGGNLVAPIDATFPALPVGGVVTFPTFPANATYRSFNATAGYVYRVSTCGAYFPTPATPITDDLVMHIRTGATGAVPVPGACDNDGCGIPNGPASVTFVAPISQTYKMYLYRNGACRLNGGAFVADMNGITIENLGPIPVPANDEPCGAVELGPLFASCGTPVAGTTEGATLTTLNSLSVPPLVPSSGCGSSVNFAAAGSGGDVWFKLTVPATGYIGINTGGGSICAGALGLYTAPDCTAGPYNWVGGAGLCSIDGLYGATTAPGIIINPANYGLVAGQTLYIRYWERQNNENGGFTICAYNPPVPDGQDPCNSILLNVTDPCTPILYSNENMLPIASNMTMSPVTVSCGNPAIPVTTPPGVINDMWFRVVVPSTGQMTVSTFAGTLSDMAMAWYRLGTGTLCGPGQMVQITGAGCNDDQSPSNKMPRINSSTGPVALTIGETIYVRIWNREPLRANYYGTFSICVTPNTPPPNDDPCGAISLDVNGDCVLYQSTNENALNTLNLPGTFAPGASTVAAPSCGGATNGDVWYTVNVPTDLNAPYGLTIDTDDQNPLDFAMAVYRDISPLGCASAMQLVEVSGGCAVGGSIQGNAAMPRLTLNIGAITAGERLYVRVWRQTVAQGIFSICVRRTDPIKCSGTFYDSGGPAGNYSNSENINSVALSLFCPNKVGDVVTLTFSEFNVESGYDFMYIYNGPSAASPLIGTYTGTNGPGTITASLVGNPSGCLYVRFTSDGIITAPGYTFKQSCSPPLATTGGPSGICGSTIYDPGGPSGSSYPGNLGVQGAGIAPFHQVLCPPVAGEVLTLDFSSFNVEQYWDGLYIFNANIPAGTALNTPAVLATQFNSGVGPQGTWSGPYNPPTPPNGPFNNSGASPGQITSTITAANPDGCLTLVFYTDAIVGGSGWQATVICGPPPPPDPPPVGDCGVVFYDPGGATGNYGNNQTSTQTYCAPAGELMTVEFTQFSTEVNWDKLYVFAGPTTASPMIASNNGAGFGPAPFGPGAYWGNGLPGPFTSTTPGGCLTFYFVTDGSVTNSGYKAKTKCAPQAPNDNPCTPTGATLLLVNNSCVPQTFNNNNSTPTTGPPQAGCGNYQGGDVWYKFVAPPSGRVFIDSHAGTLTDGTMALYSAATCSGPFTLIECNDDGGQGLMPQIDRMCNPLTPGVTYWLRFFGYAGQRGTYDLCLVTSDAQTSLQSDCLGAFTLCSDQPFNTSNLGSGCSSELSLANWGCLAGGERQGSWYAFSVQNAGTLGMTLTPAGDMDLDWAIWGPFSPALNGAVLSTCIPTAPPKRCSNASLYNTMTANAGSAATGMGGTFGSPLTVINDAAMDGWVPGMNVTAGQVYLLFVDDHHLNGGTYNVSWTATPTVLGTDVMNCTILPVELLTFDAKARTEHVDVLWSTATELNSSHFIVQRSADSEHFLDIGRVSAAGQSTSAIDYTFADRDPLSGISYYRLKQVDLDGSGHVSNMVPVVFGPGQRGIELYPNPAVDHVWVIFDAPAEGKVRWQITDASGRNADQGYFGGAKGRNGLSIELNKLETGTYLLQLYDEQNGPIGQARFVKQH